jgi:hypothetical protein
MSTDIRDVYNALPVETTGAFSANFDARNDKVYALAFAFELQQQARNADFFDAAKNDMVVSQLQGVLEMLNIPLDIAGVPLNKAGMLAALKTWGTANVPAPAAGGVNGAGGGGGGGGGVNVPGGGGGGGGAPPAVPADPVHDEDFVSADCDLFAKQLPSAKRTLALNVRRQLVAHLGAAAGHGVPVVSFKVVQYILGMAVPPSGSLFAAGSTLPGKLRDAMAEMFNSSQQDVSVRWSTFDASECRIMNRALLQLGCAVLAQLIPNTSWEGLYCMFMPTLAILNIEIFSATTALLDQAKAQQVLEAVHGGGTVPLSLSPPELQFTQQPQPQTQADTRKRGRDQKGGVLANPVAPQTITLPSGKVVNLTAYDYKRKPLSTYSAADKTSACPNCLGLHPTGGGYCRFFKIAKPSGW